MKEMNTLETQLRSWKPRRPSATLKQKIFAATTDIAPKALLPFSWFAPAIACALIALAVLNQENGNPISSVHPEIMVALSNQSYAAYLPGSFQNSENRLPIDTFDWTNGSRSTSSMNFLRSGKTNN